MSANNSKRKLAIAGGVFDIIAGAYWSFYGTIMRSIANFFNNGDGDYAAVVSFLAIVCIIKGIYNCAAFNPKVIRISAYINVITMLGMCAYIYATRSGESLSQFLSTFYLGFIWLVSSEILYLLAVEKKKNKPKDNATQLKALEQQLQKDMQKLQNQNSDQ